MTDRLDPDAPIVIGGLGGSGTRVVGEVLIRSGVHLGHNLNDANDNLTATVLFVRPPFMRSADSRRKAEVFRRIRRLLLADGVTLSDRLAPFPAAVRSGHTEGFRRRMRAALGVRRERGPGAATHWGWKEPNSHLFIEPLADLFSGLRFVYMARHPLDMAFSSNLSQLRNWGPDFGMAKTGVADTDAVAQVDWWIKATDTAIERGEQLLGDRFLYLRFDDLIDEPRSEISRLVGHAGIQLGEQLRDELAALVKTPKTHGRHLDHDLTMFRNDQVEAIERLWQAR